MRVATKNKYLQFQEEADPEIWQRSVNHEKSNHMADHGTTEEEKKDEKETKESSDDDSESQPTPQRSPSRNSSDTEVNNDQQKHEITGKKIDSEKGKDINVVDWYDENDPEVWRSVQALRFVY